MEMSNLKVPIIAIIIGEGGSGGALALAVADQVWMLENSMYGRPRALKALPLSSGKTAVGPWKQPNS